MSKEIENNRSYTRIGQLQAEVAALRQQIERRDTEYRIQAGLIDSLRSERAALRQRLAELEQK